MAVFGETPEQVKARMDRMRERRWGKYREGTPEMTGPLLSPESYTKQVETFGRFNNQALLRARRQLRKDVMNPNLDAKARRKKVRESLETISLLYACAAADGAEFRQSVALAVDLGGFKVESGEAAKVRAKKSASDAALRADTLRRQALMEREAATNPGGKEQF